MQVSAGACRRMPLMQRAPLAQPGVAAVAGEERRLALPERHVRMHARAVVAEEALGMKLRRSRTAACRDDVFVILHPVAHLLHRREADVDLRSLAVATS